MILERATVARQSDGTPYSHRYADVYHSAQGGVAQARHVFLSGNGLPARWAGRRIFTVVETGFGVGLNFLATWQAWRDDSRRCERLHYVSVEMHPFSREDLAALHADHGGLADLAATLRAAWPELVPGMHRLHFESGRVTLTLAFADVAEALPQLRCSADAFYLDGFAPDRNPRMWARDVFCDCARIAAADATAATYTTARAVQDGLAEAGFTVRRQPGFGRKRHMLAASFSRERSAAASRPPSGNAAVGREALVIGAGLAGAAAAERLAARGWHVTVIDQSCGPAGGASGLHAGILHPHVSRDDSMLSRLSRHGFLYALRAMRELETSGHVFSWHACGVAQPARSDAEARHMMETLARHDYPESYARYLECDALSRTSGGRLRFGGYWFPPGAWVRPAQLVRALLAQSGARLAFGARVDTLVRGGDAWRALDAAGSVIAEAPVVVLANAADAARLAPIGETPQIIRGQLTYLPRSAVQPLTSVIAGRPCVLPPVDGITVAGGTYDIGDEAPVPTPASHERNLEGLRQLLAEPFPRIDAAELEGAVGFRAVPADRLPLVGPIPDLERARSDARAPVRGRLADVPRMPGLYGAYGYASRGLTWAAAGGEVLASRIEGEPCPLEAKLVDAIDPARMTLRSLRRKTTTSDAGRARQRARL